jgi:hypothetical protein
MTQKGEWGKPVEMNEDAGKPKAPPKTEKVSYETFKEIVVCTQASMIEVAKSPELFSSMRDGFIFGLLAGGIIEEEYLLKYEQELFDHLRSQNEEAWRGAIPTLTVALILDGADVRPYSEKYREVVGRGIQWARIYEKREEKERAGEACEVNSEG